MRVVNPRNMQGAALFSPVLHMEMDTAAPMGRMTEVLREGPNVKPVTRLVSTSRDGLDAASVLYNQVDEGVHRLVMLSNKRIQELELVMEFEKVEECFKEVRPVCQFW